MKLKQKDIKVEIESKESKTYYKYKSLIMII